MRWFSVRTNYTQKMVDAALSYLVPHLHPHSTGTCWDSMRFVPKSPRRMTKLQRRSYATRCSTAWVIDCKAVNKVCMHLFLEYLYIICFLSRFLLYLFFGLHNLFCIERVENFKIEEYFRNFYFKMSKKFT